MSTQEKIKRIIIELLSDGRIHTTEEINEEVRNEVEDLDKSSTAIRNVLFNLKKTTSNLKNVKRGQYIWKDDKNDSESDDIQFYIETINKRIKNLKKFDWMVCSDQELTMARRDVKLLKNLAYNIEKQL